MPVSNERIDVAREIDEKRQQFEDQSREWTPADDEELEQLEQRFNNLEDDERRTARFQRARQALEAPRNVPQGLEAVAESGGFLTSTPSPEDELRSFSRWRQPGTPEDENPRLQAFWKYCIRGSAELTDFEKRALNVGTAAQGGHLAPEEFERSLTRLINEISPIRQFARITPVSLGTLEVPRLTASGSATLVTESGTRSDTSGSWTFAKTTIPTYEIQCRVDFSRHLENDSAIPLEQELTQEIAEKIAVAEASYFLTGTGSSQPEGITVNSDVTDVTAGVAGAIDFDDIIDLMKNLKAPVAPNARLFMNRRTIADLRTLKASTAGTYLWGDVSGAENRIFGVPVVEVEQMPDVGTGNVSVVYGDLNGAYRVVDQGGVEVLRDPYTDAATGAIRLFVWRKTGAAVTGTDRIVRLQHP